MLYWKSIGIKSEMFNLITGFIIYVLPVDEEQLQLHTSLKMCLRISKNKKVFNLVTPYPVNGNVFILH